MFKDHSEETKVDFLSEVTETSSKEYNYVLQDRHQMAMAPTFIAAGFIPSGTGRSRIMRKSVGLRKKLTFFLFSIWILSKEELVYI